MCPKLIELLTWNGPTIRVCCFMLSRASTKTFVSRVQKSEKNLCQLKNSLALSLPSRGITVFCLLVVYVEMFPQSKGHFTTMQNKWSNNSVNLLIFNVFESGWNELSIITKQHFMNVGFFCQFILNLSCLWCFVQIRMFRDGHMISFLPQL